MPKKYGLGRGLDSLFLENEQTPDEHSIQTIKTALIDPRVGQPRKAFDSEALAQLADSIAAHGVLQPIIVREIPAGRYEIIAGERRWRAAKLAGLTEVPAVIVDKDDLAVAQISLVENIQRENLNPLEEAFAYRALADQFEMTQEEIARQVGKSRSAIANTTRLLDLPEEVYPLLSSGQLSAGHARALLGLKDPVQIPILANRIVAVDLSVRETEEEVKRLNRPAKEQPAEPADVVDYVADLESRLFRTLGRKVKINAKGSKKSVTLYYEDNMDLEVLLQQLCGKGFVDEV